MTEPIRLPLLPLRGYQRDVFRAYDAGLRRFFLLWARRISKTRTLMELMMKAAFERPGQYAYVSPTLVMARRIVWDGLDHTGRRMLTEVIPPALIRNLTESDMTATLINGSKFPVPRRG
jgi:hypothetical protein